MNIIVDTLNLNRAINFFNLYDYEKITGDSPKKYYLGTKTSPRKCRFCSRTSETVSFKMDAHVIPQFMGNKNLLSYFECDECNNRFSKYEDSFANFIGAARTISQIPGQGKNKVPKFNDKKTGFEIKLGETSLEMSVMEGSKEVTLDEDQKKIIVRTVRPSYVPLHIAKIMLKIGISLIDEEDLINYQDSIDLIKDDVNDKYLAGNKLLHVYAYHMPGPTFFPTPSAILFKRKALTSDLIPSKQIVLYYGNYVLQFCIPYCKLDDHLLGGKINIPLMPLLVDHTLFLKYGTYHSFTLDTTASEKVINEPHVLTFSYKSLKKRDYPFS